MFGETLTLPVALAVVLVVAGLAIKPALGDAWHRAGGPLLLLGVVAVLVVAVASSAGGRPRVRRRAALRRQTARWRLTTLADDVAQLGDRHVLDERLAAARSS